MVYLFMAILSVFQFVEGNSSIDIVYAWVDGEDEEWQKERNQYLHQDDSSDGLNANRFRSRDELKYSLRSIDMFAPFIRHIFIVTNGQRPKWLRDHERVTIVSHKEIFNDTNNLPTFNALAIEANLHRIPGLSEKYIYFNDDFFLGRKVSEGDFFNKKGMVRVFETNREIPTHYDEVSNNTLMCAAVRTSELLKKTFGVNRKPRFLHHVPYVMRKSLVEEVERKFPEVFLKSSMFRFRSVEAYRITCCLFQYAALFSKKAVSSHAEIGYVPFKSDLSRDKKRLDTILEKKPTFFCVQDETETVSKDAEEYLTWFFEKQYPRAAPWEF